MSVPADALRRHMGTRASRIIDGTGVHGDLEIAARIDRVAEWLLRRGLQRVASRLDNSLEWFVLDLALQQLGGVHVPLPTFFSNGQVAHAMASSGVQCVITASGSGVPAGADVPSGSLESGTLECWRTPQREMAPLPPGTSCITFTSGTTGTAKGVCLDNATLLQVAGSLVEAAAGISPRRHLCLMPLATLLENVAGLYAALLADAQIALPSLAEIGYSGASGLDVPTLLRCLHRYQPESVILVPQLLLALVMAGEQGATLPRSLRYVAVGGGRVAPDLLVRARALGLPVFEGYGLTECASVVCVNRPDAYRDGSVGRPLPHSRVREVDGELVVEGAAFLGYLGETGRVDGPVRTGDLGYVDGDGFVHVTGRRGNMFITAFGRNVSPEWVESELTAHPLLGQAVVWGEGQSDNIAVLVPRRAATDDAALGRAVAEVNAGLPDYAQVVRFVRAAPFAAADGLMTVNGRPRRAEILSRYRAQIDACYRLAPSVPPTGIIP